MQDQLFDAGGHIRHATGRDYTYRRKQCRELGCTKLTRAVSGAAYCEEHARSKQRGPLNADMSHKAARVCITPQCETIFRIYKYYTPSGTTEAWNEFCPNCHSQSPLSIATMRRHKVPYEIAKQWLLQGAQLKCDLCGGQLGRRFRPATIDHRHGCCPGQKSCGECIRGVLCSRCNTSIGHLEAIIEGIGLERAVHWVGPPSF